MEAPYYLRKGVHKAITAMYGISVRPLIDKLSLICEAEQLQQVWFADDCSGGGKLPKLKEYLTILTKDGPTYGFKPKFSKTVLILKREEDLARATDMFKDFPGITITTEGKRHIGAALGTLAYKNEFVNEKVAKWCADVSKLAEFATDEPQLALTAFNMSISKRWSYTQRTIPDTAELFQPLENTIKDVLIPAIVGRAISDTEREILSLPLRYGGLGILKPTERAPIEYETSKLISSSLAECIYNQDMNIENVDKAEEKYNAKRQERRTMKRIQKKWQE